MANHTEEIVELNSKRLQFRKATTLDAIFLHRVFSDPEVMRYWSELPHKDMERTSEWIANMTNNQQNGVTDFIICLKPELIPIGKIGVWSGDEIGFLLDRTHWHKGLAKEAMNEILTYLFNVRKFTSISADVDPRNDASLGILRVFGFVEERYEANTIQVGDKWVDSVYLRLSKEQWDVLERRKRFSDYVT